MAKRRIEDSEQLEEKKPVLVADSNSNIIYILDVFCLRCSRLTSVCLRATDLPEWARAFLKSVRFDNPDDPCTEMSRTKPWLADKTANKHALELQALCEPPKWTDGKPNKCVRNTILDSLKAQYPDSNVEQGLFFELHKRAKTETFIKVVAGYKELLTPETRLIPENSILNRGRVVIMENWRDDIK